MYFKLGSIPLVLQFNVWEQLPDLQLPDPYLVGCCHYMCMHMYTYMACTYRIQVHWPTQTHVGFLNVSHMIWNLVASFYIYVYIHMHTYEFSVWGCHCKGIFMWSSHYIRTLYVEWPIQKDSLYGKAISACMCANI